MPNDDVKKWWSKWNNRLMHPEDMSRGRRAAMMQEVADMVSVRDRTIQTLLDADPESPHLDGIKVDARVLIGAEN